MKVLITGGAGFIGSNLTESLLQDNRIELVRVLDNFATGFKENLEPFMKDPKFELVEGDIRDFKTCQNAIDQINVISHQAALGSVPRSVSDPITTNNVNITGSLNIINAAKEANAKVVFAASSSTYGDHKSLPKVEDEIGNPLSPYAVTKLVNELYAKVFSSIYDFNYIGLRYFNVFGPRQSPKGAYAAVIPLFFDALLKGEAPTIHGDGLQSRDFTYVGNAVHANTQAIFSENKEAWNQIYNIAYGQQTSLVELYKIIQNLVGSDLEANFGPTRAGDVKHSLANISKANRLLNYKPKVTVEEGLEKTFKWSKVSKV